MATLYQVLKGSAPKLTVVESVDVASRRQIRVPVYSHVERTRWNTPAIIDYRTIPNPSYKPNPFLDENGDCPIDLQGLNRLYYREPDRYDDNTGHLVEIGGRLRAGEPFLLYVDQRERNGDLYGSSEWLLLDGIAYPGVYREGFIDEWWKAVDRYPQLPQAVLAQNWPVVRVFVDHILANLPPLEGGIPFTFNKR